MKADEAYSIIWNNYDFPNLDRKGLSQLWIDAFNISKELVFEELSTFQEYFWDSLNREQIDIMEGIMNSYNITNLRGNRPKTREEILIN